MQKRSNDGQGQEDLTMRSIRIALLVALAALGVTALSAIAAEAFEWRIEGKTMKALGLKEETKTSEGGSFLFESSIAKVDIELECEKETDTGKVFSELSGAGKEGTGEETMSFSGKCKVVKPSGCTVAEPIKVAAKTRLVELEKVMYEVYEPLAGAMFGEITIGVCAVKGAYKLKGAFCGEVEPLLTELVEQPVRFSQARLDICVAKAKIADFTLEGVHAVFTGNSKRKLSGANAFQKWGSS
jgi:hypothetical protein